MIKKIKSKIPQPVKRILKNIIYFYQRIPLIKSLVRYFKIKRLLKFPSQIALEVTNHCNARCPTCENYRLRRPKGYMALDLFKKIINECLDYKKYVKDISLFWIGEPFLDSTFFDKVKYIKDRYNFFLFTVSNGSLMNKEIAQKLIDLKFDKVVFSVDGASQESFAKSRPGLNFEQVRDNIKQLIELKRVQNKKKPRVDLEMTINPYNQQEVDDFKNYWQGLADSVCVRPMHVWGSQTINQDLIDFSQNLIKTRRSQNHPCFHLWKTMPIAQDGSVGLCCVDSQVNEALGDLNQDKIVDLWQQGRLAEIRKLHQKGRLTDYLLCRTCNFRQTKDDPWWWS